MRVNYLVQYSRCNTFISCLIFSDIIIFKGQTRSFCIDVFHNFTFSYFLRFKGIHRRH